MLTLPREFARIANFEFKASIIALYTFLSDIGKERRVRVLHTIMLTSKVEFDGVIVIDATTSAASTANAEVVAEYKALSTKDRAKHGATLSADGLSLSITDTLKFKAWLDSIQPVDADDDADDEATETVAKPWMKGAKYRDELGNAIAIAEPVIDDNDLIEVIVQSVGLRRYRSGKNAGKAFSLGLVCNCVDGITVRKIRVTLGAGYVKAVIDAENGVKSDRASREKISDKAITDWGIALKGKGILVSRTRQVAGQTGYLVAEALMSERERAAWDALDDAAKANAHKAGDRIGFVHVTSGVRFNLVDQLSADETATLNDEIANAKAAITAAAAIAANTAATVQGEETRLEQQLEALKRLLDRKMITKAEYDIRRAKVLDKV